MFEQFSKEFEDAARDFDEEWGFRRIGLAHIGVDLADEGDQFIVTADVPGYEKDEIDVQIQNNTLRIRAKHEQEAEERKEALIRSEREHREMRESVTLPEPVDEDNITASCNNGVLTVHLPKKEPTEPSRKKIEVE